MGELITSVHAFAAASSALLQQHRRAAANAAAGGAVAVDVSMERAGVWSAGCMVTWLAVDAHKAKLWDAAPSRIPATWPIPTLTAVTTSDGVCLQLLGLDFPKHLMPTMRALKAPLRFWLELSWVLVSKVLVDTHSPTRILKLVPLLEVANVFILAACKRSTHADLAASFAKHGVWYTVVKSPGQALAYEQARVTGAFRPREGEPAVAAGATFIASPTQFA